MYCRTYPFIRDSYAWLELSVDNTCPGVGRGAPITEETVEEIFLLERKLRPECPTTLEASADYKVICGSLKAKGVYVDHEVMKSVCGNLIAEAMGFRHSAKIAAFFQRSSSALIAALNDRGNIVRPEDCAALVRAADDHQDWATPHRFLRLACPFKEADEPIAICLDDGRIPRHSLAYTQGRFLVRDALSVQQEVGPGLLQGSRLTDGAARTLEGYLGQWLSRQLLLRYVHSLALAFPQKVSVLSYFFDFLFFVVSRVFVTAEALRILHDHQTTDREIIREAIRANDSFLRTKCASTVSRHEK